RHNKLDTTSLQREYRVDHGVIQAYHCSPGSHYHAPMPLRDHGIPNLCLSRETDHTLEPTSILCLPPLSLCHLRRIDSSPMSNVVGRVPGADSSTMQTINPRWFFRQLRQLLLCPWILQQVSPRPLKLILHATAMCVNNHSLLDCHANSRQHCHNLNVKNQEFDMHERRFKCKTIGCRMGFNRQDHLERHTRSHLKEKPYGCWVSGCHRAFSRRDNLKVHCTKSHTRRGGRNRYVATLDETSPDYDPEFRGQLSFDGRPLRLLAPINSIPEVKPLQP
ncbi:unnamed protein product, partial [Penicillium nalgiovense]